MRRALLSLLLLSLPTILGGCAKAHSVHGRVDGLREIVDQAARNGAMVCAPRQLALARAHLTFAENELRHGDAIRAEEHIRIAEPNGRAAFRLSPAERCNPRGIIVEEAPEPPPPPKPGDRDGDGIPDDIDRCPDEPEDFDGFEDEDGCPEDQDSDGDGIPDSRDMCPLEPEDFDGYLDADGCPEPDNDLDGVPDTVDNCALDPEDHDGFRDEDGCPDPDNDLDGVPDIDDRCPNEAGPADNEGCPRVYEDVEVTTTHIRIRQTVHFETGKAIIKSESFGILNTVATVLKDFPDIKLEIQGHTDSVGNDNYNLKLSQQRADSVMDYLMGQGIDSRRMRAVGYGETRPIESNRTASGRAANRRVEFMRTDEAAESDPAVP